jgi:hypothetical protein
MGEQMIMIKSEVGGQPPVVSDDLVQSVDQKSCERWCFTISELSFECPKISCTVLYEIITFSLSNHKFCERWVSEMLMGAHRLQKMSSAFADILERYHKDGNQFLNHIVSVTGDETCVSFVNVET